MSIKPSPQTFSEDVLENWNRALEQQSLEEVLEWCYHNLPGLVQVTSFGSAGMCILHAMSKLKLKVPVIFLDTLYHFEETLEHARQVTQQYQLDVHWYRNAEVSTRAEFEALHNSTDMWISDPTRFEQLTKVGPLERALNELNVGAWFNGRRSDQGASREGIQILELDPTDGRIKVNALANWSREQVWEYLKNEGIPYNPLYDKSYSSIGDTVTTAQNSDPSQGERAGRFYQFEGTKTECGIHNRRKNLATIEVSKESVVVR